MEIHFDLTISDKTISFNGFADLFRGRIEGSWVQKSATADIDGQKTKGIFKILQNKEKPKLKI